MKNMLILLLVVLSVGGSPETTSAQSMNNGLPKSTQHRAYRKFEAGLFAGASYYEGDLTKTVLFNVKETHFAGGLIARSPRKGST